MACGTCGRLRRELVDNIRRGDVAAAAKTVGKAVKHMARPAPATARFSRKK